MRGRGHGRWLLLAFVAALALATASTALALNPWPDSPAKNPPANSETALNWTGQGTTNGALDTSQCDPNNTPYLYWVLTPGGTVDLTGTHGPPPVLNLGGSGSGSYNYSLDTGNTIKFITPYFPLANLQASVSMYVIDPGGSTWGLKISHGCAGGGGGNTPPASDLTAINSAGGSFDSTYSWTIDKTVDGSSTADTSTGSATFNYAVTVTKSGPVNGNYQVSGEVDVFNPNVDGSNNPVPVNHVTVTDAIDNGGTCTVTGGNDVTIASGEESFDYTCTYSGDPSSLTNVTDTATVSWTAQTLSNGDPLAANTTTWPATFDLSANPINDCVDVSDPLAPGDGDLGTVCSTTTFPDYSVTFSGDTPGTCTQHDNTATFTSLDNADVTGSSTATVTDCVGADLTASTDATPSFTRQYAWTIDKSADPSTVYTKGGADGSSTYTVDVNHDNGTDSNWAVTGTITITNPNNWEDVTLTNLSDALDSSGACTLDTPGPYVVPESDSLQVGYTCATASAADTLNTATATWDAGTYSTPDGSASDSASVAFTTPTTVVDGSVTVTDPAYTGGSPAGTLGTASYTDTNPIEFTYDGTVSGAAGTCTPNVNTASFVTSDTHATGSDSATVTDCQGADLSVGKTATPSFTRTYHWGISKSVDKTKVDQASGSVVFNYVVSVTHDSGTDSGWQVNGVITVSNPNNWEAITANVTDSIDNNGTCTVSGGNGASIPAATDAAHPGTATFPYTCTFSSNPGAGTNTATATWDAGSASTPDGSATGTAPYDFSTVSPSISGGSINVTDTLYGGPLGTASYTDASPKAFPYSHSVTVKSDQCQTINNTATIVQTGANASKSVQVCGLVTGGLTMGYWQNKNGQAEITGAGPSSGTCSLTAGLRAYAPFQDLAATSTCSQVATYVTGIIKNASAAGAAMNAMLKGQMLATALDVLLHHVNGSENFDLTKVYGSENASSAFSGLTCMKINDILTYAASQSNAGGTTWYGQNKTVQGYAKDTFDSINNANGFTC